MIRAVLLDIEGTTTPLAFVHTVLFPYARARLGEFVEALVATPEGLAWLERLRAEWTADAATGAAPPEWAGAQASAAIAYAGWLMDRDRKSPELKRLQGWIWERGYDAGELHGEVFPDVPPALARWRAAGIDLAIYSSGSVLAQRLLFGRTRHGDLTPLFAGFFDTRVGAKTDSESYRTIAAALHHAPADVLFVSDVVAELYAARGAGMAVTLCVRPGNLAQPETDAPKVHDFDELAPSHHPMP